MRRTTSTSIIKKSDENSNNINTATQPLEITFEYATEKNKEKYLNEVLDWLKSDFKEKDEPSGHFWHNRGIIAKSFDKLEGMVVLNKQKEVIAYMIWSASYYGQGLSAEIDIIEVKDQYRKKGVFRSTIENFCQKFPDICVLSAGVIEQAEDAFSHAGWKKVANSNYNNDNTTRYTKIVKPALKPLNTLPDGLVFAINPTDDFYRVNANIEKYKNSMRYFQIQLDEKNKLLEPIIIHSHADGYIGVYKDKKLIEANKGKYLFKGGYDVVDDLLVIGQIVPNEPHLYKDFITILSPGIDRDDLSTDDEVVEVKQDASLYFSNTANNINNNVLPFESKSVSEQKIDSSSFASDLNEESIQNLISGILGNDEKLPQEFTQNKKRKKN